MVDREPRRTAANGTKSRRRTTTKDPRIATPTIVVPDTAERQTDAALANLQAAEAKRNGSTAPASLRRGRTPTKLPAESVPVRSEPDGVRKLRSIQDAEDFDLDAALSNLQDEYIQCRDFGHSWRPFTARWLSKQNAYESQLQCQRCKTIRTRWLSRTGSQLSGGYEYPDNYLMPHGAGRLTGTDRDKIRLASILQVIKD